MRKIRGDRNHMIFQEPMTSLNPVFTIGDQIIEAIELHQKPTRGGWACEQRWQRRIAEHRAHQPAWASRRQAAA